MVTKKIRDDHQKISPQRRGKKAPQGLPQRHEGHEEKRKQYSMVNVEQADSQPTPAY
jgi:hypothetical protein